MSFPVSVNHDGRLTKKGIRKEIISDPFDLCLKSGRWGKLLQTWEIIRLK